MPTVGSGGTYSTWYDAMSNIAFPLTDDVTLQQISDIAETQSGFLPANQDLGGYSLRITSSNPHNGRPDQGWVTTVNALQGPFRLWNLTNGNIEIQDLRFEGISPSYFSQAIYITAKTGVTAKIHDIIAYAADSIRMGSNQAVMRLEASNGEVQGWNLIVDTYANTLSPIAGCYGIETAALGINSVIRLENCVSQLRGTTFREKGAFHNANTGSTCEVYLRNCVGYVANPTGSSRRAFKDYQSASGTTYGYNNASSDESATAFETTSDGIVSISMSDEFKSTGYGVPADYFVPTYGDLSYKGSAPAIADNDEGIRNTARPHNGLYSIGAVEVVVPTPSGDFTLGASGDFADWHALAANLILPLAGPTKITQISDTTIDGAVVLNGSLGGDSLTIDNAEPHNGVYGGGYVTYVKGTSGSGFDFTFDNGSFEMKDIEFRADEDLIGGFFKFNATIAVPSKIHDIVATSDSSNRLTDHAIQLLLFQTATQVSVWNMLIDVVIDTVSSKAALYNTTGGNADLFFENCTIRITSASANWGIRTEGADSGETYTFRNVYSIFEGGGGGASFSDNGALTGTQDHCGSSDATAGIFTTAVDPQNNLTNQLISTDPALTAYWFAPISDTEIADNGTTPQIVENTTDMRGTDRLGTSIGAIQVIPVVIGNNAGVTALTAASTDEGPQILVRWNLPNSTYSLLIKLIKKEKNYPTDISDGTELLSEFVSVGTTHYVDLGPDIDTVWCYAMFTYHACGQVWTADTLIEVGETVVPTSATGFFYEARTRGLTGSTEPLEWPTQIGEIVQDGDTVWECRGTNPGWITSKQAQDATFTWDSEYMQDLLFQKLPAAYRNADAKSNIERLDSQQDPDFYDVWRALHDDGTTARGEFQRFLMLFGIALARVRGAADFYPRLIDPDECPPQFLPFLAGILGWELNTTKTTGAQRQAILSAVPQYKRKGTVPMLESLIRQASNVSDAFVDPMSQHIMMANRINRLSARGSVVNPYSEWAMGASYSRGDIVIPTYANRTGYYYQTREAGVSGGAEPAWPTTPGQDVTDGGTIVWRTVRFGLPHLTADASASSASITVDDTSEFEVGKTVNVRDYANHGVDSFTADSAITLEAGEGDVSSHYPAGRKFKILGSTGGLNDGVYTVASATSAVPTVITTVEETIVTEGSPSPAISNPEGEEQIIALIPDSTTLDFEDTLASSYAVSDLAVVSPAYDWYDDETGFIWDIPRIDQFEGISPDRVRVAGEILDPSELYSFEILRLWFFPESGDALTTAELEQIASVMNQFAPSDTTYVIRVESP